MKKLFLFVLALALIFPAFSGEAYEIAKKSTEKSTAQESVTYIEEHLAGVSSNTERRALYIFLGQLHEQLSEYDLARESYAYAAGIAAGNAENMSRKSNEQLVLDAVRCALSLGDSAMAESYLNSAVRNSGDATIQAYIKLYTQWSALCRATTPAQVNDAVVMLKAYSEISSVSAVHPAIFLTLWYVTGEQNWAEKLKQKYPASIEAAVVSGKASLLPSPFWFFVLRTGNAQPEIADEEVSSINISENHLSEKSQDVSADETEKKEDSRTAASEKPLYLQLGLFRNKDNAQDLVAKLQEKGFAPRIISEVRPSGTQYYIVAVDENATGTAGKELKTIGFESYPVFE